MHKKTFKKIVSIIVMTFVILSSCMPNYTVLSFADEEAQLEEDATNEDLVEEIVEEFTEDLEVLSEENNEILEVSVGEEEVLIQEEDMPKLEEGKYNQSEENQEKEENPVGEEASKEEAVDQNEPDGPEEDVIEETQEDVVKENEDAQEKLEESLSGEKTNESINEIEEEIIEEDIKEEEDEIPNMEKEGSESKEEGPKEDEISSSKDSEKPIKEEPKEDKSEQTEPEKTVEEIKEEPKEEKVEESQPDNKEELSEEDKEEPNPEEVKEGVKEEVKADTKTEEPKEEPQKEETPEGEPEEKVEEKEEKEPEVFNYIPVIKYFTPLDNSLLSYPLSKEAVITYSFGEMDELHPEGHNGIDFAISSGVEVLAAESGTVIRADYYGEYGNTVFIDHGNGIETRYAHLSEVNVSTGDSVIRGQQIGRVGSTGHSTGPHLHFEVLHNGEFVDPMLYLGKQMDFELDFSSKRLIVKGSAKELKNEPVIAVLGGVSLLQYETIDEAKAAYIRLLKVCESIEVDSIISVAEGENTGEPSEMTKEDNPFKELAEALKVDEKESFDVAVIDTGANNAEKIVSVIGDDGLDINGHGQRMIDIVKFMSPKAKVLSIKAIGDNGTGDISSVYAAIKLAIESNVRIINLSISSLKTEDSFIVEQAINEAIEKGIIVVGAAGNNGIDARFTIPGSIENAVICGAAKGNASNFGETVDCFVNVYTTSVAASIVSGILVDSKDEDEILVRLSQIHDDFDEEIERFKPTNSFSIANPRSNFGAIGGTGKFAGEQNRVNYSNYGGGNTVSVIVEAEITVDGEDKTVAATCIQPDVPGMDFDDFNLGDTYSTDLVNGSAALAKAMYYGQTTVDSVALKASNCSSFQNIAMDIAGDYGHAGDTDYAYLITHHAAAFAYGYANWDAYAGGTGVIEAVGDYLTAIENLPDPPSNYEIYVMRRSGRQDYALENVWPPYGSLKLTKVSVDPSITDGNSSYSLEGAIFEIFKDAACTQYVTDSDGYYLAFKTDANGKGWKAYWNTSTNSYEYWTNNSSCPDYIELLEGTYYVKETKAPTGFKLPTGSDAIKKVTILANQTAALEITFTEDFEQGKLKLKKVSSEPSITNGNNCYSFEGAIFEIYKDAACTQYVRDKDGYYLAFKTDANGKGWKAYWKTSTNSYEYWTNDSSCPDYIELPYGKYYLKEIKAPKGYTLPTGSDAIKEANVTGGQTAEVAVTFPDTPNKDPIGILLTKLDEGLGTANPQGAGTLKNAEYTVRYYKGTSASGTPERSWVLKSNDNGYVYMSNANKVSGPDFYYDPYGMPAFPAGVVTIKETAPPKFDDGRSGGYSLDETLYTVYFLVQADNTIAPFWDAAGTRPVTSTIDSQGKASLDIQSKEKPANYPVQVKKADSNGIINQGDAKITGIKFAVINRSDNPVIFNNRKIESKQIITFLTTKSDGTTDIINLPLGKYEIRELRQDSSWAIGDNIDTGSASKNGTSIYANSTGYLYKNYTETKDVSNPNETLLWQVSDEVARQDVKIEKWDAALGRKVSQGDADFSGIKFEIWNRSDNPVSVGGTTYAKDAKITNTVLTTNAEGDARTTGNRLPYGTYEIKEVSSNGKYRLTDGTARTFRVRANGGDPITTSTSGNSLTFKNEVSTGSISITKTDANITQAQGDAKLNGIRFAIVNDSVNLVKVNGVERGKGEVIQILSTDANGKVNSANLPYGTYTVYELRSDATIAVGDTYSGSSRLGSSIYANNYGYLFKSQKSDPIKLYEDGKTASVSFSNEVARQDVKIEKWDAALGRKVSQGDADFSGIKFEIWNKSENPISVGGTTYAKDAKITNTVLTTNAEGDARTTGNRLPYGTYEIKEVSSNGKYRLTDGTARTFRVRANGGDPITTSTAGNSLTFKNEVSTGSISITKTDANITQAQGDAKLNGIRFAIVNDSINPVKVNGVERGKGEVIQILSTDANGKVNSANLPYGTYTVYELRSDATIAVGDTYSGSSRLGSSIYANNYGYLFKNQKSDPVKLYEDGKTAFVNFSDEIARGDIKIEKWDKELNKKASQGDADFSGIRFEIWNRSENPVSVGGTTYAKDAKITNTVLTTNAEGDAQTTGNRLPYGTYEIKEVATNGKYLLTDGTARTFEIRTDGQVVTQDKAKNNITFKDNPVRGGVKFGKIDAEMDKNAPQGYATLQGAEITIYNNSSKSVIVNGKEYAKEQPVLTVKTGSNGEVSTAKDALPYGTYYAVETKPSEGYLINSSFRVDFQIRENEKIVDTTLASQKITLPVDSAKSGWLSVTGSTNSAKLPEDIIRADASWFKIDIDGSPMPHVPFLVSRLDKDGNVVESHVIITDENGRLNTADRPNTGEKVNSLDGYVSDGRYTGPLDGTTGIWFGEQSAREEGRGSFIYARYIIEELQAASTEGMDMLKQPMFSETFDMNEKFTEGKIFQLDNIFVNLIIHPRSELIDDASETKVASILKEAKVTDSLSWDHLKVGQEYKLKTIIYYEDREGNVRKLGENTQPLVPKKVDSTNTSLGTEYNTVTVDTSNLNGGKLHAVDEIYAVVDGRDILIASHNKELDAESQTIGLPFVETFASDSKTLDHQGTEEVKAEISDIVKYENFPNKGSFNVVATLKFADTGEIVKDVNGKDCIVKATLNTDHRVTEVRIEDDGTIIGPLSGEFKMPSFKFDASKLEGRTLVVTEEIFDKVTKEKFVEHNDLADENQSIHYSRVGTLASDSKTGQHTGVVTKDNKVIDRVLVENIVEGYEYTVKGKLVRKDTLKVIATGETSFIGAETGGKEVVEIEFNLDSTVLEEVSAVAYEYLFHNDVEVAKHEEPEDPEQTVNYPKVRTMAVDKATKSHTGLAIENTEIIDTVKLTNLTVGEKYKVVGTLMTSDGEKFLIEDAPVTVESEVFEATEKNMTIDISFIFDGREIKGKTLVVFEKLFHVNDEDKENPKETEVANHEDPKDEGQTVNYPDGKTNATDSKTNSHTGTIGKTEIIVDKVTYSNLTIGDKYTITGDLHYREDFIDRDGVSHKEGDIVKDKDGNVITAETEFVALEKDGFVLLNYEVDSEILSGATIVVFEDFYNENVKVFSHADLEDDNQTIYYPEVKTTLLSKKTGDHIGDADKKTVMVDTVELKNLVVNEEYTLRGTLMDLDTKKPIKNSDGSDVVSEPLTFTATERSMTFDIEFILDGKARENMTTVAFEELIHKGVLVSYHADFNDKDQTVWTPKVETKAKDAETNVNIGRPRKETVIVDTITLSNLVIGKSYTVTGYLMNQNTGEKYIDGDGNEVEGEPLTFVANKTVETKEMTFTFNASNLKGTTVVVFEDLKHNDVTIAAHHDINSIPQSVDYPDGKTEAKDAKTDTHMTKAEAKATVVDTFYYYNLRPGYTYLVKADLVNKETREIVAMKTLELTPEKKDGKLEIEFTFNAELLVGETLVAFETVEYKGVEVITHKDINDEEQTIYIPKARTTAKDAKTDTHMTLAEKDAKVIDIVKYENLVPGKTYTVKGTLMDKSTGKAALVDGKEITAEKTFEAKKSSGEVELVFTFDASILKGKTLVAFEKLLHNGKEVAVHEDINDEAQTIYIPAIRTVAKSKADSSKFISSKENQIIVDTVYYEGLKANQPYTAVLTVLDKTEGKLIEGLEVRKTFTASESGTGEINVEVTVNGKELSGHLLVMFERAFEGRHPDGDIPENPVASHEDPDDIDQTIGIPEIRTMIKDSKTGTNVVSPYWVNDVEDIVFYKGLIPGMEYELRGKFMSKADGTETEVTGTIKFTPEKSDGEVVVPFTFDGTKLNGNDYVAFEELWHSGKLIAEHKDLNDEDQLVRVNPIGKIDLDKNIPKTNIPGTERRVAPLTGDSSDIVLWLILFIISISFLILSGGKIRKNRKG